MEIKGWFFLKIFLAYCKYLFIFECYIVSYKSCFFYFVNCEIIA